MHFVLVLHLRIVNASVKEGLNLLHLLVSGRSKVLYLWDFSDQAKWCH